MTSLSKHFKIALLFSLCACGSPQPQADRSATPSAANDPQRERSVGIGSAPAAAFTGLGKPMAFFRHGLTKWSKSPVLGNATDTVRVESGPANPIEITVRRPSPKNIHIADSWDQLQPANVYILESIKSARVKYPTGDLEVRFPKPQVPYLFTAKIKGHLVLSDLQDLILDFQGASFLYQDKKHGIYIEKSSRLVVKDLRARHNFSLASYGKLKFTNGRSRIEIDPAFYHIYDVLDPKDVSIDLLTGLTFAGSTPFPGSDHSLEAARTNLSNIVYANRVFSCPVDSSSCGLDRLGADGIDIAIINYKNVGNGIHVTDGSEDITLENISLSNIAGCGVFGLRNGRGLHLKSVVVAPTDNVQYMGASACGFRARLAGGDIVVEDSKFISLGDDGINVNDDNWTIKTSPPDQGAVPEIAINGNILEATLISDAVKKISASEIGIPGHTAVLMDSGMKPTIGFELTEVLEPSAGVVKIKGKILTTSEPNVLSSSVFANLDMLTRRTLVANNSLGRSRARGILIHSSHFVAKDNKIFANARSGVFVDADLGTFHEGFGAANLKIVDNEFSGNNYALWADQGRKSGVYADLTVTTTLGGATPFAKDTVFFDLLIAGNKFTRSTGSMLQITSTRNATVRDNNFEKIRPRNQNPIGSGLAYPESLSGSAFYNFGLNLVTTTLVGDATYKGIFQAENK